MGIATYIKNIFYPPKCAVCKNTLDISRKSPFCADCQYELSRALSQKCRDCRNDMHQCTCVPSSLKNEGFLFHVKLFGYNPSDRTDPVNRLVYTMKASERREIYDWLALMLEPELKGAISAACQTSSLRPVITYVPRSKKSVAKYGFDQAELLARALSRRLSIPTVSAVKRKNLNDAEMKKLNAVSRFSAGANAFEPVLGCSVGKGDLLIIVDDVLTSGASVYWTAKTASALGVTDFAVCTVAKTC